MMKRKATIFSGLFLTACVIFFIISCYLNADYFYAIAHTSVVIYQLKQFFALVLMMTLGLLFICQIRSHADLSWCFLMAMPCGMCLWCTASFLLLVFGATYSFSITAVLVMTCIATMRFLSKYISCKSMVDLAELADSLPIIFILTGIALICASGFTYVFLSYDSLFYFNNYGRALTILGSFKNIAGENSFTLTNIGQFLPFLNSYTAFFGLDQCFQLQAYLLADLVLIFMYRMYQHTDSPLFSALSTGLLVTSTPFIVCGSWVLANMYCMAFIFLFVIIAENERYFGRAMGSRTLLAAFLMALAMLRKDGIIFACFLIIWYSLSTDIRRSEFVRIILPAFTVSLGWIFYVRIVLDAKVSQSAPQSIANNKNIALVLAIIMLTVLYVFFIQRFLARRLPRLRQDLLICGGMTVMIALLAVKRFDHVVDNVDMTIRNLLLFPSAWGISACIIAVLICLSILAGNFFDTDTFLWLGYVLLNFLSYSVVASKHLWVNWDDSYSRVLMQMVPVIIFVSCKKIWRLLSEG